MDGIRTSESGITSGFCYGLAPTGRRWLTADNLCPDGIFPPGRGAPAAFQRNCSGRIISAGQGKVAILTTGRTINLLEQLLLARLWR